MDIYEPAEDSYLLSKQVSLYAQGRVLDMGTGSGIQALEAIKNASVREVIAVDCDENVVQKLKETISSKRLRKIKVIQSDLFEHVTGHFNVIIFNPPYLPQDEGIVDPALYGGKKGWEISARFFNDVSCYLGGTGKILFLFSTLTNKQKIEELICDNLLEFTQIASQKLAFEELYVYEIVKSEILRTLESQNLQDIHFLAKGKRGIVYSAVLDRTKHIKTHLLTTKDLLDVVVKIEHPQSTAMNRIENEVNWLKKLNEKGIGPSFIFARDSFFVMKFIQGDLLLPWISQHEKKDIQCVLGLILDQCRTLDIMQVNKEEMHHPHKHIIVTTKNKPVMIDFERCSNTDKPKNVTQVLEFFCRMNQELDQKGIQFDVEQLRELSKEYKDTYGKEVYAEMRRIVCHQ
jgi:release factor glutamine methyltransferase